VIFVTFSLLFVVFN